MAGDNRSLHRDEQSLLAQIDDFRVQLGVFYDDCHCAFYFDPGEFEAIKRRKDVLVLTAQGLDCNFFIELCHVQMSREQRFRASLKLSN